MKTQRSQKFFLIKKKKNPRSKDKSPVYNFMHTATMRRRGEAKERTGRESGIGDEYPVFVLLDNINTELKM